MVVASVSLHSLFWWGSASSSIAAPCLCRRKLAAPLNRLSAAGSADFLFLLPSLTVHFLSSSVSRLKSSSAVWILHYEYVIPEATCGSTIHAQRDLCCCCFFAAASTAAHICYHSAAAGLLDWKRPAGSDLDTPALEDELHSEPVVMQRLEWYDRWLRVDSHLHSGRQPESPPEERQPPHFPSCLVCR